MFEINLVPNYIFYITSKEDIIEKRLLKRKDFQFDKIFFKYENEVYKQMLELCDIMNTIDNSYDIDNSIFHIDNIITKNNLLRRRK